MPLSAPSSGSRRCSGGAIRKEKKCCLGGPGSYDLLDRNIALCREYAFWHGLFGGIYIPVLRQAVYEHLIRAERMAEEKGGYFLNGGG